MADISTRRIVVIAAIAGALVGGAVGGGVAVAATSGNGDSPAGSTESSSSVATAAVVRTTLTNTVQVGGSIGYQGSFTVSVPAGTSAQQIAQAQQVTTQDRQTLAVDEQASSGTTSGDALTIAAARTRLQDDEANLAYIRAIAANPGTTYTALPQVGGVIREDQPVYSLSNEPVPLLYGPIVAYRAFYVGMSDGADVGQFTHDLITLGYGAGLSESDHYSASTVTAVERWQHALGLPATGEILLGGVVFEPGPLRVTSVTPAVGQSVGAGGGGGGGGAVLTATSTTPIVMVDLDVADEYLVKPGDAVSIVLPDGTSTVGGRIKTVGTVATCAGGGGVGTGSGGPAGGLSSPCSSAGGGGGGGGAGGNSTPTVTVTITLDSTPLLATLDQAPVNVNITTQRADHVLAAPVNALLALAGGGFGVDVVTGGTSHLAGVTTGLYDNTLVQISGSGITVGTRVEVPSS